MMFWWRRRRETSKAALELAHHLHGDVADGVPDTNLARISNFDSLLFKMSLSSPQTMAIGGSTRYHGNQIQNFLRERFG